MMNDRHEEFVKVEVSNLVEAKGKLGEVLELVEGLPMMIPKSVAALVARLGFTTAYTQVTRDLIGINIEMLEDLSKTIGEMQTFSEANERKIREEINEILTRLAEE